MLILDKVYLCICLSLWLIVKWSNGFNLFGWFIVKIIVWCVIVDGKDLRLEGNWNLFVNFGFIKIILIWLVINFFVFKLINLDKILFFVYVFRKFENWFKVMYLFVFINLK